MLDESRSVWIVNHYVSDPRDTASGSRHFSIGAALQASGWKVSLIAASAGHNSDLQRVPERGGMATTVHNGVTTRWLRTENYSGNGLGRIRSMFEFTLMVLRKRSLSGLTPPDIVVGSTVHPLAAWAAKILARRFDVPFIFEIRDLWPQTLIDMGKLRQNGLPARLMRLLESHLCKAAERIVVLMPLASDYLEPRGVPRDKVVWVSNGTDIADFGHTTAPTTLPFVFMYIGSLGSANGVEAIIDGFAKFRATTSMPSRLIVIGDGPQRDALQTRATKLSIGSEVSFNGPIPKSEVPRFASQAHALVLNVLDLKLYRYGISLNKLFDYMAAARPIIIASNASNNPVRDSNGGVTVAADDGSEIAQAMAEVVDATYERRVAWGQAARRHVSEQYDYVGLAARFEEVLVSALDSHQRKAGQQK